MVPGKWDGATVPLAAQHYSRAVVWFAVISPYVPVSYERSHMVMCMYMVRWSIVAHVIIIIFQLPTLYCSYKV